MYTIRRTNVSTEMFFAIQTTPQVKYGNCGVPCGRMNTEWSNINVLLVVNKKILVSFF